MNNISYYNDLYNVLIESGFLRNFQEDFTEHDLRTFQRNPAGEMVHAARHNGTNVLDFDAFRDKDWSNPEELRRNIKHVYIFTFQEQNILFHHLHDGTIKKISKQQAKKLFIRCIQAICTQYIINLRRKQSQLDIRQHATRAGYERKIRKYEDVRDIFQILENNNKHL